MTARAATATRVGLSPVTCDDVRRRQGTGYGFEDGPDTARRNQGAGPDQPPARARIGYCDSRHVRDRPGGAIRCAAAFISVACWSPCPPRQFDMSSQLSLGGLDVTASIRGRNRALTLAIEGCNAQHALLRCVNAEGYATATAGSGSGQPQVSLDRSCMRSGQTAPRPSAIPGSYYNIDRPEDSLNKLTSGPYTLG